MAHTEFGFQVVQKFLGEYCRCLRIADLLNQN